jgi:hypothetical protein
MKTISKITALLACVTSFSLFARTVQVTNKTPYTLIINTHTVGASKDIKDAVVQPGGSVSTNALADLLTSIKATTQTAYQQTAHGEHVEAINLGASQMRIGGGYGQGQGLEAATTTTIYVAQGINKMRVLDSSEINSITQPQTISGSYSSAGQSVYNNWSVYRSYNFPVVDGKTVAQETLMIKWD